jgi:hypothetical protein
LAQRRRQPPSRLNIPLAKEKRATQEVTWEFCGERETFVAQYIAADTVCTFSSIPD